MIGTVAMQQSGEAAQARQPSDPTSQADRQPTATREELGVISTGFVSLDRVLGVGGLPKGRISEVLGRPNSGKDVLALKFLAQAQAAGKVDYINLSGSFDPTLARRCGLDLSRFTLGQPRDLEEALTMIEAVIRMGGPAALALDATNTLWANSDDTRCVATFLHRLTAPLARARTAFLVVSSFTGLPGFATFADVRLQVTHRRWIEEEGDVRGRQANVQVLKNRFAPPGGSVVLSMRFDEIVHGHRPVENH
jgi:recombination protein RecA